MWVESWGLGVRASCSAWSITPGWVPGVRVGGFGWVGEVGRGGEDGQNFEITTDLADLASLSAVPPQVADGRGYACKWGLVMTGVRRGVF